jgi:hypothetical protein
VDKRSRTHDQMVQAARSGGKNIAEGSRAAATTSQTELRLVNVARASLEELLLEADQRLGAGICSGGWLQRATGGGAHRGAAKTAGAPHRAHSCCSCLSTVR